MTMVLAWMLAGAVAGPAATDDAAEAGTAIRTMLAAVPNTRFGLVVTDAAGVERIAIAPDDRFVPASNTKILTTAAAYATLPMTDHDRAATGIRIEGRNVVLHGAGDARLSGARDCVVDCLATLADAVARRTRVVANVIGDDSLFPDQRWSPGMGWNNIPTRSGTGVSALTVDDNELVLTVSRAPGGGVRVDGPDYYRIDNRIASGSRTAIAYDRMPGSDRLRLWGSIGPAPEQIRVGIDDPAHFAAWTLARLLRERGVRVTGTVGTRHRPYRSTDDGAVVARATASPMLATTQPAPLSDDVAITNKRSQNLHAELLLRRAGAVAGTGSIADGVRQVATMMAAAGVPRTAWDVSDGSGMSTYNRITPRAMVRLLQWIDRQPWGTAWHATLPVAGVDGTLARRFRGTALAGKLSAKTGSLSGTSALAGTMRAASGQVLTFAFYANDIPEGVSATPTMDAALLAVAARF